MMIYLFSLILFKNILAYEDDFIDKYECWNSRCNNKIEPTEECKRYMECYIISCDSYQHCNLLINIDLSLVPCKSKFTGIDIYCEKTCLVGFPVPDEYIDICVPINSSDSSSSQISSSSSSQIFSNDSSSSSSFQISSSSSSQMRSNSSNDLSSSSKIILNNLNIIMLFISLFYQF